MQCTMCRYEWCWDCGAVFTEGHGWLCNPFGCNISKNSCQRNKCVAWTLSCLYVILGLLVFPFALVLYVPCASAIKGGGMINDCLNTWHESKISTDANAIDLSDNDQDDRYFCSSMRSDGRRRARSRRCSCFCFMRVVVVGFCGLVFFILGLIANCIAVPLFLIMLVFCLPCYLCITTCTKR